MSTTSRKSVVPWQIWGAVFILAVEGLGNLRSSLNIFNGYLPLVWLGVKAILVAGLLFRWPPIYIAAVLLSLFHIAFFATAAPVAALANLVLLALLLSAFRFYFPKAQLAQPVAGTTLRSRMVWSAVGAVFLMFVTGVTFRAGYWMVHRELVAQVVDSTTGEIIPGAVVNIRSPERTYGAIINRSPRTDALGQTRVILPSKIVAQDFKGFIEAHAEGYESGEWELTNIERDFSRGQMVLPLKKQDGSSKAAAGFAPAL
ncbi:MAG: hypothetical protein ACK4UN_09750 [Limisphaerales bacterium]